MKRRLIPVLLVLIVLVAVFSACQSPVGENLLVNGEFKAVDSVVKGWSVDKAGSSDVFVENAQDSDLYRPEGGTHFARISSSSKSNVYLSQVVKLAKDAKYCLKVDVYVESVSATNDVGVVVGFLEDTDYVGLNLVSVTNGWRTYELYFTSQTNADMTLTLGLGNSKNKASGEVSFDNVSLSRVDAFPDGVTAGVVKNPTDMSLADGVSISFVVLFAIGSVIVAYALYFLYRKTVAVEQLPASGKLADEGKPRLTGVAKSLVSPFAVFLYIMLGAFAVRFVALLATYGMGGVVNSYVDIGTIVAENGLTNVMTGENAVNQPIGVVWIMSLFGLLANAVGIEYGSLGYSILVRLPNIIADIVLCYMIYSYVQKYQSERQAAIFSALYAFVPVFFVFSALYGSMESTAIVFAIAMFLAMVDKRHIAAGIWYTVALAFSNYMLVLLPVILVYQITALVTEKNSRVAVSATMIGSFVVFYALSAILQTAEIAAGNVLYPFKKIYAFFASNAQVCTDSFNLYAIFGGANKLVRSGVLDAFQWLFVIAMGGLMAFQYVRSRNRLDLVLMGSWMVGAYAILGAQSNPALLPLAIVLLLVYIVLVPDRRLYGIFVALSTLSFLNIAQLLSMNGYLTATESGTDIHFASNSAFLIVGSILAVATLFYYLYVVVSITVYEQTNDIPPMTRKFKDELRYIARMEWRNNK